MYKQQSFNMLFFSKPLPMLTKFGQDWGFLYMSEANSITFAGQISNQPMIKNVLTAIIQGCFIGKHESVICYTTIKLH